MMITERKLTSKEQSIIEGIYNKASKRPHVKQYHVSFIVDYMLEGFKNFTYDCKQDAIDMLDAIFEVALKCSVLTTKQINKEKKYMLKEYVKGWFDDEKN